MTARLASFLILFLAGSVTAASAQERLTPEEVEAFQARALELLSDRNYDSKGSEHYLVRTDDPRVDVVKVSAFLEGFWRHFESVFSGAAELRDQKEPVEILLFYSRYKYDRLHEDMPGIGSAGVAGHYRSDLDVVAVHTDAVPPGDLPGLLSHEAAHHLVAQRLNGPELVAMSRWVSEGLGGYFGFTRMDRKGRFLAGQIGGQEATLLRKTAASRARNPGIQLNGFKRLMKGAEPGFIEDLIRDEMQGFFYFEETIERYTAAWLLVHYFIHGDDGAHFGAFREFIALDAGGKGGAEALYKVMGMTAEELESAFVAYVKKLKSK